MKNKKTIIAGSMLAGAMLSISAINANNSSLFNYNALGNGSEVRTNIELTCSDKKADDKKSTDKKTTDKKAKDGKCGEKKAKDGKCGEGKCGEKKNPK